MTDEKFVYYQEQRDRASTARGARYKKGHTGKGGCTLPNDNLSRREWMKKNGEVTTMDPHKFYTYEEFKSLSDRLQIEYLNYLCEKYKVGISTIDRVVFNAESKTRLYTHLSKHGLLHAVNPKGYRGYRGGKKLAEDVYASRMAVMTEASTEVTTEEPVIIEPKVHKGLKRCDITMNALDISFIQLIVRQFDNRPIRIRLEITEEETSNA